jgi:pimeloyl-ACP methyl ester carboxylesterase
MKRIQIPLAGGLNLSAIEAGSGHPLIMIPGWSQTAAEFDQNIEALARSSRIIALDMRGHGESDKPKTGYRIARLAHDLADVIDKLGLDRADLLGHSMGSSVIWSYLDLFGPGRVRKLVIVDQAPCVTAKPGWSDSEKSNYGCLFPDAAAFGGFYSTVASTGDVEGTMNILKGMFTAGFPAEQLRFIAEENLKFPRLHAADLLHDHCYLDWRDLIATIRLETLVIGGDKSIFSAASQRWIASKIPGAEVDIFPEAEGGSHFMFAENPARFNARVAAFLAK